jgi:hypothetical protein
MITFEIRQIYPVDRRRIDQHGIQAIFFSQMVGVMPAQRRADQGHSAIRPLDHG